MKKNIIAIVLALSCLNGYSQTKDSKWTITLRVGVSVSDYKMEKNDDLSAQAGLGFGIEAEYKLSPLFGLSAGVFYTKQAMKHQYGQFMGLDEQRQYHCLYNDKPIASAVDLDHYPSYVYYYGHTTKWDCLNIPVMANFHVWKGLTLKTGLQLDCRLNAKHDFSYDSRNSSPIINGQNMAAEADGMKYIVGNEQPYHDMLLSIPLGVSYEYKNLELDARYQFGTHDLLKYASPNITPNSFLLTLGYNFHL